MRLAPIFLALALLPASILRADAFDPSVVPATAKWVLHLDADATRASGLWNLVEPRLQNHPRYDEFVNAARAYAGAEFPRDLHGLTVYGTGFNEASAVVLVDATVDQARVTDLLQMGAAQPPKTQGARQVFSWQDEKGQQFGTFAGSRFVIARGEQNLQAALDVLDEKAAAMKTAPGVEGPAAADVMLYIAGQDLQQLAAVAKNPMIQNVKDVWLSLSSSADAVKIRGVLSAVNADTAIQVRDVFNGLKGMALLSVNDPKHDEATRAALRTLSALSANAEGAAVTMDWSIPLPVVDQLIQIVQAKRFGSGAAPAASPAPAR
jgi:hypothetical protein